MGLLKHGAYGSLFTEADSYPGIDGTDLTPLDVTVDKETRKLLQRKHPSLFSMDSVLFDIKTLELNYNGQAVNIRNLPWTDVEKKGKFSDVVKNGKPTLWGTDVVAKRLTSPKLSAADGWNYTRFENTFRVEVGMMGKLRHPNICQLLAASYDRLGKETGDGEHFYLIMEKMDTDFATVCTSFQVPVDDILETAVQISKAVNYLHHQSPPI